MSFELSKEDTEALQVAAGVLFKLANKLHSDAHNMLGHLCSSLTYGNPINNVAVLKDGYERHILCNSYTDACVVMDALQGFGKFDLISLKEDGKVEFSYSA